MLCDVPEEALECVVSEFSKPLLWSPPASTPRRGLPPTCKCGAVTGGHDPQSTQSKPAQYQGQLSSILLSYSRGGLPTHGCFAMPGSTVASSLRSVIELLSPTPATCVFERRQNCTGVVTILQIYGMKSPRGGLEALRMGSSCLYCLLSLCSS